MISLHTLTMVLSWSALSNNPIMTVWPCNPHISAITIPNNKIITFIIKYHPNAIVCWVCYVSRSCITQIMYSSRTMLYSTEYRTGISRPTSTLAWAIHSLGSGSTKIKNPTLVCSGFRREISSARSSRPRSAMDRMSIVYLSPGISCSVFPSRVKTKYVPWLKSKFSRIS